MPIFAPLFRKMSQQVHIRVGTPEDVPQLLALIEELALYEKAPEEVRVTSETLLQDGFGPEPLYRFLVAEIGEDTVGIALYYFGYSTWKGKMMYLDDLIVSEKFRRNGVGRVLFDRLMQVAQAEQAQQLRWHVLDWNEPAIKFYEMIQAELDPEWITGKISYKQIQDFKPGQWE
jgi:GNAT superfamily N-acetyltransferase